MLDWWPKIYNFELYIYGKNFPKIFVGKLCLLRTALTQDKCTLRYFQHVQVYINYCMPTNDSNLSRNIIRYRKYIILSSCFLSPKTKNYIVMIREVKGQITNARENFHSYRNCYS